MGRIMIAEDHAGIRLLLQEIVVRAGHQVVGVSVNGAETANDYFRRMPDLAIIDQDMPGIGESHAVDAILSADDRAKLIVFVTGGGEGISRLSGNDRVVVLSKPFEVQDIVLAIEKLTNR